MSAPPIVPNARCCFVCQGRFVREGDGATRAMALSGARFDPIGCNVCGACVYIGDRPELAEHYLRRKASPPHAT